MIYRFGGCELDTDVYGLTSDGTARAVEPQVFDLLVYLVERRDRVVTKNELLDDIWGDRFVSESALTSAVKAARRAVGDDGRAQRIIRTVHGRGYQFVAAVDMADDEVGERPTGTVTFVFTDIEASSRLWADHADAMPAALAQRDRVIRSTSQQHGGVVFGSGGDSLAVAFAGVADALAAARAAQADLRTQDWPDDMELRVQMGVHSGEAVARDGDYVGPAVHQAARVTAAANGGQILVSGVSVQLLGNADGLTDLGVHRLRDVGGTWRLFQLGAEEFPPLDTVAARLGNLPARPTALIGREEELDVVSALVDAGRLVTITGPGGVGKTRFATELAGRLADSYADGVYLVELTKVPDPAMVPGLIQETLGLRSDWGVGPEELLAESLLDQEMLLVLDNFEHVIEAAPAVAKLLDRTAELNVVATSRERLRLAGEHVFELQPLSIEPCVDDVLGCDAALLFEQAARSVEPGFVLDATNGDDVLAVCQQLDGLPLAIELAAAQTRVLPPNLLRARLGSRLEALKGGPRDAPARHHTIRAMLDWSYDLLEPAERALFRRLSVFVGPVSLPMAEAIAASAPDVDTVTALGALIDKSLVRRTLGRDGSPRFGYLELIGEYAAERLEAAGEADEARGCHAEYMADDVTRHENARWADSPDLAVAAINEQFGNLAAAVSWSNEVGRPEVAARIAARLYGYWHREGRHGEGVDWISTALQHESELDPLTVGQLHTGMGYIEFLHRRTDAAREHYERAVDVFRSTGVERYVALGLVNVAATYIGSSADYDSAIELGAEGISLARSVGESALIAYALTVQGEIARMHGDAQQARIVYEEALVLARTIGDTGQESIVLSNLGYLADHAADYREAERLRLEALRGSWRHGRRLMMAWTLGELAGTELGFGRLERAARLVGVSEAAMRRLGGSIGPGDEPEHERVRAELEAELGPERLAELVAEGAGVRLEAAVTQMLGETP